MKRVISGLLATALLGFTPVALASSASAESGAGVSSRPTAEAPSFEATRTVTLRGFKKNGSLFARGRVTPNYRNSTVVVKRRTSENGPFRVYKRIKTNGQGRYRTSIQAPPRLGQEWGYITFVPKRGDYNSKRSDRIVTTFKTRS